ncbi:MAG: GNAT family N-acetyltransferase [Mycobacteriaceae bacterium]
MQVLWPADEPVRLRARGLILREWTYEDVPDLVELFDTDEMNRWTPLPSPFDQAAAVRYVDAAHRQRVAEGTLQLAITRDGAAPMGEVLIVEIPASHVSFVPQPEAATQLILRAVEATATAS